jgi:putative ABC transport system substrate-binding protein
MADHGLMEGRNLTLEVRSADFQLDRLAALADELVGVNLDVLVCDGSNATLAASRASTTLPIVGVGFDPIPGGVVRTLAHPGGNVTVVANYGGDLTSKALQMVQSALPNLRRLAALGNLSAQTTSGQLSRTKEAAQSLAIDVLPLTVSSVDDLEPAFARAQTWQAQAIQVLPDGGGVINGSISTIANLALRGGIPAISIVSANVERGFALSYGTNLAALFRRAAYFVDRILGGASPADLPVEQPAAFTFAANRTTLQALGLTMPPSVAAQVTEWVD